MGTPTPRSSPMAAAETLLLKESEQNAVEVEELFFVEACGSFYRLFLGGQSFASVFLDVLALHNAALLTFQTVIVLVDEY